MKGLPSASPTRRRIEPEGLRSLLDFLKSGLIKFSASSQRILRAVMNQQDRHLYEFEGFVLDAGNRILLKDGVNVRLTPKAFETLLLLVQNAVQVVEKEQFLKEVWRGSFVEEGSLSQNIHELRKALGDASSEPRYIQTIPKRGYRFVAQVRISADKTGQMGLGGTTDETTVIEKHTFARVISHQLEETELPSEVASSPTVGAEKLALPGDSGQRRRNKILASVVAVLLLAGAFVFFYLRPAPAGPAPSSRAKSTLVRLTNNNAIDAGPVWSPDGKKIAFFSNRDGKNEIYVMDADGSNVQRLTNNLSDDTGPKWSPDGRKILFETDRDGNREAYVMDADGSNQTRLTRNNAVDSPSSWSPDGSKIAFASNRDNNFEIYIMNADGTGVQRIVDDPEFDAEPKWSPDGRKILFVTGRSGNFDLYEMNPDGTGQRNLTASSGAGDRIGSWSPDGKTIAFVRNTNGKEQIYIMDANGGNLKRVTNNSANNLYPAWSPDGSKLLFQTDRDGNFEIYVMSVDGELLQLTDDAADDLSPDWSPDGSKIAFSSNRDGKQHIYIMNADGGSPVELTHTSAEDTEPTWSPDGKRIAFARAADGKHDIYLMNADGSNQTPLTFDAGIATCPKWSSDGRILFVNRQEGQRGIYVLDSDGTNVTRLSDLRAHQAVWSPDATLVAFNAPGLEKIGGHSWLQLFVIGSGGGNVRMVTRLPNSAFVPCWSPDGASIAFVVEDHPKVNLFQIDLDGTNLRRLTAGPTYDERPAFSPDGSKLAFQSNRDGNYEIYVMNLR